MPQINNTVTTMNHSTQNARVRPKQKTKRCPCGKKNISQACNNCSKYKLVFLLNNRSDHLKNTDASGKLANPVFWSFIKDQHKTPEAIFNKMLGRLKDTDEFKAANVIQFYYRNGSKPLFTHKP